MKRSSFYGLMLVLCLLTVAPGLFAQCILILERPGTVVNTKYKTGDHIIVSKKNDAKKISGKLNKINDSVLLIDYSNEVKIKDIDYIYKERGLAMLVSEIGWKAGIAYFLIDAANHLTTNSEGLVATSTIIASSSLIATAIIFKNIRYKNYKIGDNWRLRVLNFEQTTFN